MLTLDLMCCKVVDANNPAEKTEDRDVLSFEGPTDSVYLGAPEHVELDVGTGAAQNTPSVLFMTLWPYVQADAVTAKVYSSSKLYTQDARCMTHDCED